MDQRFIPYQKLSKKKKRLINARNRKNWGQMNPSTKKIENKKLYSRKKKSKDWDD